jgi:hypothetical protein
MAGIAGAFCKFPVAFALDFLVLLDELWVAAGMFVRHENLLCRTTPLCLDGFREALLVQHRAHLIDFTILRLYELSERPKDVELAAPLGLVLSKFRIICGT